MLQAIITHCPECNEKRCLSRQANDQFECRACATQYPEGGWNYSARNPNKSDICTTYAFMSSNRSKTPHSRRVLGLPSGHPDHIASSEKDAMRICEKNNIDYETQEFLTSDDKTRAIEAARKVVGVKD